MQQEPLSIIEHKVLTIILQETSDEKHISSYILVEKLGIGAFGPTNKTGAVLKVVNDLRFKGYPICSSSTGFFYPRSPEMLRRFVNRLQTRIEPTMKLIEALNDSFGNVGTPGNGDRLTVSLPVRSGTGVSYQEFEMGEDGRPMVPPDVELI